MKCRRKRRRRQLDRLFLDRGRAQGAQGEVMKTQNGTIEIDMLANGFLVRPRREPGAYMTLEECHAFNSISDLSKWLFDHFDNHHAKPNDGGKRK